MPVLLTSAATDQPVTIYGSYPVGTQAGRYFLAVWRDGAPEVIGQFTIPAGHQGGTFAKRAFLSPGPYTIGGSGNTDGDISVYTAKFDPARGAWTLNGVDRAITAALSGTTAIQQRSQPVRSAVDDDVVRDLDDRVPPGTPGRR